MPNRTIEEARAVLDQMMLSPQERRHKEREIEWARRSMLSELQADLDVQRERLTPAIKDLKRSHDLFDEEMAKLKAEGKAGDLSAADFARRFAEIERQREQLTNRAEEMERDIERFAAKEADPDAWIDTFLERYPLLRPAFTF